MNSRQIGRLKIDQFDTLISRFAASGIGIAGFSARQVITCPRWLGRGWGGPIWELIVILEPQQQGLSVPTVDRRIGLARGTVPKYRARGIEPPAYTPRRPRSTKLTAYEHYLRNRIAAYRELTASRPLREISERGYSGGYTTLKDFLRTVRPPEAAGFEARSETPPGRQAQVDFGYFCTAFTDRPEAKRIVRLFSLVLGHSRMQWGRFVPHQDMQTMLRCHAAAFGALGRDSQ